MKAEKDKKTGKWLIQFRYTDWQGVRRKTTKRGFATKREVEEYVRNFLASQQADFNMNFQEFLKLYYDDMTPRLRENTMRNKKYIIDLKILPYFSNRRMNGITAADIRKWQNELISQGYSQTYLRTINNQLTAVFNYAVRYYDLQNNPCRKAGGMGKNKADEMKFWTKDEFYKFIDSIMDKQKSYAAFMALFWTGMRLGELLALTPADIDFENKTISISKSYQRLDGKDVTTLPKTPKRKGKHYAEVLAEKNGYPTIRGQIKDELDEIIKCSYAYKDFWRILKQRGYEVKRDVKYIALKPAYSQSYIRLKSLGDNYSEEAIRQRIIAARNGIQILDKPATDYNAWLKKYEPTKLNGFKALYYHYLYLFGKIRKKETPQRVSFYMREELIKFERYQKQFHFLIDNDIETTE